jgi:hypothetical protein
MMQIIRQEFSDRVDEINIYFHLLENITEKDAQLIFPDDNDRRESLNVRLGLTLKSGLILLLYNLVESTVSKCLKGIHQTHINEGLDYFSLSKDLQQIIVKHHYKLLIGSKLSDELIAQLRQILENQTISISSEKEWRSFFDSQFSGNLDALEVKKIAKKYGIAFELESTEVRFVEQMRNKLAHGEVSFEEGCRDKPMQYMQKMKNETISFLESFIQSVEIYISDKKYKK